MRHYLLMLTTLLALLPACKESDDPAIEPEPTVVQPESYLTEVIMQHFAILDNEGRLKCRTEYNDIDRSSLDTSLIYAVAPDLVKARSIYCHLVAAQTLDRIEANADSTTLSYKIAGNPRALTFSASSTGGQVAEIGLPYTDAYSAIATRVLIVQNRGSNSGDSDDSSFDIPDHNNPDSGDAKH